MPTRPDPSRRFVRRLGSPAPAYIAISRTLRNKNHDSLKQGSNERDNSSPTERSSPVMLSAAKHLSAERDRPFAALRVTRCDGSHGQGLFFKLNLALRRSR